MKIVAVVPMKLNNTRLPHKNTKSFTNGEPLCKYILSTLKCIPELDDIYVYCSNPDIKDYIPDGIIYMKRPEKFDRDSTSMSDVLVGFANDVDADIYIMTHATAPFISARSICLGLNAVINEGYDSAFSAEKLQDFLWKSGEPFNYNLCNIPRTQDLEPIYMETSGFYIFKKSVIKTHKQRIGKNPYIVEVDKIEAIDIDEPVDFMIADAVYNYLNKEM